jgi:hypothetical protein
MGGGLDMAGDGAKDFVGGDVGPTISSNYQPGSGMDDAGAVDFAGMGRKDLFGGKTDTTEQEADKGTRADITSDKVVDFPGKGGADTGYMHY